MKYIRTKDGNIYEYSKVIISQLIGTDIIKQADTIEELCDVLVVKTKDYGISKGKIQVVDLRNIDDKSSLHNYIIRQMTNNGMFEFVYLGIETSEGIIYIAKMNEEGELELL